MASGSSFRHEGMEGTASCTLTVLDETNGTETTKSLQGCIVSSEDKNLKRFIEQWKNLKDDQNIFADHKYFFYSPYDEIITKQAKTTAICYPKNGKPDHHEKKYNLERKLNAVVVNNTHSFLLCESEKLTKSSFLEKCSIKKLGLNQSLGEEIYGHGLGNINGSVIHCFIKLKIKKCGESSSNEYQVQSPEDFKKLLNTGPILVDERQTLVGSFEKVDEESCIISCSVFEITDITADALGSRTDSEINAENQKWSKNIEKEEKEGTEDSDSEADGQDYTYDDNSSSISIESGIFDDPTDVEDNHEKSMLKETSKFCSSNSYASKEEAFKQEIQLCTKKVEEDNRQLQQQHNEELKEGIRQQEQQIEKLKEDNKQFQQQHIEELKEGIRQQEQQIEKLKEDNKQFQQQRIEELKEDKRQLKIIVILFAIILIITNEVLNKLQLFLLSLGILVTYYIFS